MSFIDALNAATGSTVVQLDYDTWLDGESGGDPDKFDAVVRQYLGDVLYDAADVCARLDTVLMVKLGQAVQPAHEQKLAQAIINNTSAYKNGF